MASRLGGNGLEMSARRGETGRLEIFFAPASLPGKELGVSAAIPALLGSERGAAMR
jgi:hypothetical protein